MQKTIDVDGKKAPMEISLEDGNATKQLKDILDQKAKEKIQLESLKNLHILSKSKFYYNANGDLREHIATYKGYAILIKQEQLRKELNEKENEVFPTLVKLQELKNMKKVNGNIVRKIQPDSLHEYEKMALVQGVVVKIDEGL